MSDMSKRLVSAAIGEAVREVRIKKRMSQFALALKSGLSQNVVREIESKTRPVTFEELRRLEYGLGEDGAWLISRAVKRRIRRDPKLRAFAVEALSAATAELKKALQADDDEVGDSSTGTVQ